MGLADVVKRVANVFMETSAPGMITNAAQRGASQMVDLLPDLPMGPGSDMLGNTMQKLNSSRGLMGNVMQQGGGRDPFSNIMGGRGGRDPFSGIMGGQGNRDPFSQVYNLGPTANQWQTADNSFSPRWQKEKDDRDAANRAFLDQQQQQSGESGGYIDSPPGATGLKGNASNARVDSIKGTDQWNDLITKASNESGVPASLIKAVMALESGGNAKVGTNTSGATGLMQVVGSIWQGTANNYGNGDLNDPWTNIRTGAEILKQNKSTYGTWEGAAAAYIGSPVKRADGSWGGGTVPDANGTNGQMYVGIISDSVAYIEAQSQANQSGGGVTVSGTGKAFPVKGYTGGLGLHHGKDPGAVDIMAPEGTPILAISGGTAVSNWSEIGGYWTMITDSNGVKYYYAHMDKMGPTGQVKTGSYIAGVSDTGNARGTGTHLHLGIGTEIFEGQGPRGGAGNYNVIDFLAGTTRF
jgi:murein DD-endopeptidase MepM/ murein hydrolase activator NlpD